MYLFFFFNFFIFGCAGSLLLRRLFSSCSEWGCSSLRCTGFLLQWLLLLQSTGSRAPSFSSRSTWAQQLHWALEHRLSSCDQWAELLHCMWDLPGSGIELKFPALVGGFFTTEPPGKPQECIFLYQFVKSFSLLFQLFIIYQQNINIKIHQLVSSLPLYIFSFILIHSPINCGKF